MTPELDLALVSVSGKDTKSLCIYYHHYQMAQDKRDDKEIIAWGDALYFLQRQVGLYVIADKALRLELNAAKTRRGDVPLDEPQSLAA